MDAKDFIEIYLIDGIGKIQETGQHNLYYLSFGIISQGIEFLGACLDSDDFFLPRESEQRFRKAITDLFPTSYHPYAVKDQPYDLYPNLRCGLLHVVMPKPDIELIQAAEVADFGGGNLDIVNVRGDMRLILVAQSLYDDFKAACEKVIRKIDNNELADPKVHQPLLKTQP